MISLSVCGISLSLRQAHNYFHFLLFKKHFTGLTAHDCGKRGHTMSNRDATTNNGFFKNLQVTGFSYHWSFLSHQRGIMLIEQ